MRPTSSFSPDHPVTSRELKRPTHYLESKSKTSRSSSPKNLSITMNIQDQRRDNYKNFALWFMRYIGNGGRIGIIWMRVKKRTRFSKRKSKSTSSADKRTSEFD